MIDTREEALAHFGKKGMRWGVRRDERALNDQDKALNIGQRSQVKVASSISALAAIGMSTNAAATLFQLQNRIERYQVAKSLLDQAEHNPFINDAGREAIKQTKNHIIKGIIGSALATTAVSIAIGIVTQRTAKAYFAPMHKVYGDSKPKINSDLRRLSKDIAAGKRPKLTVKDYNSEVSKIVQKHMTSDKKNLLSPFHELARNQLGLQYNTKQLSIKFEKLPNTDLYHKMTIVTPHGLKLVKAIKKVKHSDLVEDSDLVGDVDLLFDYKFDSEGFIEEWSCPTLEVAHEILEGNFDVDSIASRFGGAIQHNDAHMAQLADRGEEVLTHFGKKGMRWGVRNNSNTSNTGNDGFIVTTGPTTSGPTAAPPPVNKESKSYKGRVAALAVLAIAGKLLLEHMGGDVPLGPHTDPVLIDYDHMVPIHPRK